MSKARKARKTRPGAGRARTSPGRGRFRPSPSSGSGSSSPRPRRRLAQVHALLRRLPAGHARPWPRAPCLPGAIHRKKKIRLHPAFKKFLGYGLVLHYAAAALPRVDWASGGLIGGGRVAYLFVLAMACLVAGVALFVVSGRPAALAGLGLITDEEVTGQGPTQAALPRERKEGPSPRGPRMGRRARLRGHPRDPHPDLRLPALRDPLGVHGARPF